MAITYGDTSITGVQSIAASGSNNGFIIDTSGRVFQPNKPRFYAYGIGGGSFAPATYQVYPTVTINVGNCYNASNGVFTAPMAGVYLIQYSNIANSNDDVKRYHIHVNNLSTSFQFRQTTRTDGSDYAPNGTAVHLRTLAANDTVRIYFGSDNSTNQYPEVNAPNNDYIFFSCHLVA